MRSSSAITSESLEARASRRSRRGALHGDDGRRERALGRGEVERQHFGVDDRRDQLHFLQPLDARLGLLGLGRLGLEPVDEGLQVLSLVVLLLLQLELQGCCSRRCRSNWS